MVKKLRPELSEGPTAERRKQSTFTREILTPPGAPIVARYRTRPMLTPLAVRRAILEDIAQKPDTVRLRSMRRRLTVLDRALSDLEAGMLERVTNCINGLSNVNCVNYLKTEIRSTDYNRLPFSDRKRLEIEAMSFVLKGLNPLERALLLNVARKLDITTAQDTSKLCEESVLQICVLAGRIAGLYKTWYKTKSHT